MAGAGHVLNKRFRISRDVPADMSGNRARPQVVERACRGADENPDRFSFVKGFFLRVDGRDSQQTADYGEEERNGDCANRFPYKFSCELKN